MKNMHTHAKYKKLVRNKGIEIIIKNDRIKKRE